MRKKPSVLLFDMDNTLFDLVGAQIASCHKVAQHLGQDEPIGVGLADVLPRGRTFGQPVEHLPGAVLDHHHIGAGVSQCGREAVGQGRPETRWRQPHQVGGGVAEI